MKRYQTLSVLIALFVGLTSCSSGDLESAATGGVILSISDFDGLPVLIGVNATVATGGLVQVGEITIQNVAKDPFGLTSDLMTVEINSYEVTYSRADTGTRLPPSLVRGLFGSAPVGGTFVVENLPVATLEQLGNPPLSDLLFENGGFDKETNSKLIVLNFRLRFFGKTLAGDAVETAPAFFTVEFTP